MTPVHLDVLDFSAAVEGGELQRALSLYTGEFFANYEAPGSERLTEWVLKERARLQSLARATARTLARGALDAGRAADAIAAALRLREIDPVDEVGWHFLIEAAAAAGDTVRARAFADDFEAWLIREDHTPSTEGASALRLARRPAERIVGEGTDDLRTDFVGRQSAFAALHRAWTATVGGGVHHVHLESENGMGRTRLLAEFAAHLRAHRARVRLLRTHIGERALPFSACARLSAALATRSGALGIAPGSASILLALHPALSSVYSGTPSPAPLDARSVGLALSDLLQAVSEDEPLALLLDDVQWADPDSRSALALMSAASDTLRLLLVTSARAHYPLGAFAAASERLGLVPFAPVDVESLLVSLSALPDADWARQLPLQLHRAAHGIPAAVLEFLRVCIEAQVLERRDGSWHCASPEMLTDAIGGTSGRSDALARSSGPERQVLLMLAVAELPLEPDLLSAACGVTRSALVTLLVVLEERGAVRSAVEGFTLSMPVLRDAALADEGGIVRAHGALGTALRDRGDRGDAQRALKHFISAEDWSAASSMVATLLRSEPSRSRSEEEIRRLLGPKAPPQAIASVRAALRGQSRTRFAVIAIATAGALLFAVPFIRESPGTLGVQIAVSAPDGRGGGRGGIVQLTRDGWDPNRPLVVVSRSVWTTFRDFSSAHQAPRPGYDQWAQATVVTDSGEGEIELRDRSSPPIRLTFDPAQDRPWSFSPDGSSLAMGSTRWSREGRSALALMDVSSGSVARLTTDSGTVESADWSADGSRIAFVRYTQANDKLEVCLIDADGSSERCFENAEWTSVVLGGWIGEHGLLAVVDSQGSSGVRSIDLRDGSSVKIDGLGGAFAEVDPTGSWILMRIEGNGGRPTLWVAPADAPSARREVRIAGSTAAIEAQFVLDRIASSHIDSLSLGAVPPEVTRGIPHRFRAQGFDKGGALVSTPAVRWRVSGAGATVDSLGTVIARDTGELVLMASVGGWRSASARMHAGAPAPRELLREDWTGDVFSRWRAFGDPLPSVLRQATGAMAFLNDGDSRYFSGAYLRTPVPAQGGVALDLTLTTPITASQWQLLIVSLEGASDAPASTWDHRTGYLDIASQWSCVAMYPNGEGPRAIRQMGPIPQLARVLGEDAARIHDGRPWRLRVQLFTDGRCGVAVNSTALYLQQASHQSPSFATIRSVRPVIQGSSVGTRILVRELRLTSGVPDDIDWTALAPERGAGTRLIALPRPTPRSAPPAPDRSP